MSVTDMCLSKAQMQKQDERRKKRKKEEGPFLIFQRLTSIVGGLHP